MHTFHYFHEHANQAEIVQNLRQQVRRIEGFQADKRASWAFQVPVIDACLPVGGLPLSCTHEVISEGAKGLAAASGFTASLIAQALGPAPLFWIMRSGIYPPGLIAYGLKPENIIFVQVSNDKQALWAMEEVLRAKCVGAVVGEVGKLSMIASRRLQLAIESGAGAGFLLRSAADGVSACVSRWRIKSAPSGDRHNVPGVGVTRWQVQLERIRGGQPGEWLVEWQDRRFSVPEQPPVPQRSHLSAVG